MPEWSVPWKVLIPIFTAIGGVLARPVQKVIEDWLDHRRKKKLLRSALCRELAGNIDQLIKLGNWLRQQRDEAVDVAFFVDAFINTSCFQEAEKDPLLFNSLDLANHFKAVYASITLLKARYGDEGRQGLIDSCNGILYSFIERIERGKFKVEEFGDITHAIEDYSLR